ncbi:MAG: inositol monophosphatase family protein [Sphingomonadales bacterium]
MANQSALINVMTQAAQKAARSMSRDFGEVEHQQVSRKGPADFVSQADRRADDTLREELMRARPDFGITLEESGDTNVREDGPRWIVAPIDGTSNFLHGIPHFAISIAAEQFGEITACIVYEPLQDQLFWAVKGRGAYLNDRRLRVSARKNIADCLFATGIPFKGHGDFGRFTHILNEVMPQCAGIRRFGAASLDLAYVAAGRFDGFWEEGLQPWDIAAGMFLVREAGGIITDIRGSDQMLKTGGIVAANPAMHTQLHKLIAKGIKAQRDSG